MWTDLPNEFDPSNQDETASPSRNDHDQQDAGAITKPRHPVGRRLVPAIAAAMCLAATAAVTNVGATANLRPATRAAQRLAREVGALEAKDYVEASCKVNGMLMVNDRTHRSRIVKW